MTKATPLKSMKLVSTSLAALVMAGAMAACSNGGGSSDSTPPTVVTPPSTPPAPTGVTFGVDGAGLKGLILGGQVAVTDAADETIILQTGTTSMTDGSFDVTIPDTANFEGPFVRVTVSGGDGAVMICDSADGCAASDGTAVTFGESFAIDPTLTLSALAPTPADGGSATVNISVLTDLAAALADSEEGALTEDLIDSTNDQVASLFGLISSDLTLTTPINIAGDLEGVTDLDGLRTGLISGGVLSALFEADDNIGAALDRLRTDFVGANGQLIINETDDDTTLISLEDIYDGVEDVINAYTGETTAARTASAALLSDALTTRTATPDTRTKSVVSPSLNDSDLDKAKAFVSDLQLVVAAVQEEDREAAFEDFGDRVDAAAQLIEEDADSALQALINAIEDFNLAYSAFRDDGTIGLIEGEVFDVTVTENADAVTLAIQGTTVEGDSVDLTLLVNPDILTETETETGEDLEDEFTEFSALRNIERLQTFSFNGDAKFSGNVENTQVAVEIRSASLNLEDVIFTNSEMSVSERINVRQQPFANAPELTSTSFENFTTEDFDEILTVPVSKAEASLKIRQKTEDGLSFEGIVQTKLVGLSLERRNQTLSEERFSGSDFRGFLEINRQSEDRIFSTTRAAAINELGIGFSGSLSEGGQSFDVSFALDAESDDFSISEEPVTGTIFPYIVDGSTIEVDFSSGVINSIVTYSFLSGAEAQAEIDARLASGDITATERPTGGFDFRGNNNPAGRAFIPDPEAVTFRIEQNLSFKPESNIDFTFPVVISYAQAETMESLFGETTELFKQDVVNRPDDIVFWYNEGLVGPFVPVGLDLRCVEGDDGDRLFLRGSSLVDPNLDGFQGRLIDGVRYSGFCDDLSNFATYFGDIVNEDLEINPNAKAEGFVAASVSQNISGLDANNSNVIISASGPIAYADEDVTGDLTLQLEFAGRRYRTDARSIDVFEDLSVPITITNQDNVILVASEDAATGEATGTVSINGVVQGEIVENNEIVTVNFIDGTFVSIQ